MNISVFSIHFVNHLAIKHIPHSLPPVQIAFYYIMKAVCRWQLQQLKI